MSFRLKIILGLLAIQILLVAMLIWSSLHFLNASHEVELSNRAFVMAPALASLMRPAVVVGDHEELRVEIDSLLFRRGVVYIRVRDSEGAVIAEGGDQRLLARPFREDFLLEDISDGVFDVGAPIMRDGESLGHVELGLSFEEIPEVMAAARREMASIALVGLALSLVFSWALGHYFAHQLARLRNATRRIASGDVGYQLPALGDDELGQTAHAFNVMSRKLATLYAEKQEALTRARLKAQELQGSERRVHAVLDHAMDAILTFDAQGSIVDFNPAAERIFGYSVAEIAGRQIDLLIPEPWLSEQKARVAEFLRTEDEHIFGAPSEIKARHRDGSEFPAEIDVSQVRLEDRHLFIVVARDITQRRAAEAELLAAQQAALDAVRSRFEFIANVSEELRAPLSDMLRSLGILTRTGLSDEQRLRIDNMREAGDTLVTIVNDMLDFARLEAGQLEFDTIDFDLWQTIDTVCRAYRDRAAAKDLDLVHVISAAVPAMVHGDPSRLRQILVNLIDNAIKFTVNGEIVVRVDAREEADGQSMLRFEVTDTGQGIAPEVQKRIFDLLSRPQPATEMPSISGSSGLGLTIARRLTEMMHGRMGVSSSPGHGSTFWFTALLGKPHGGGPGKAAARSRAPEHELAGLKVLVVSSDEAVRAGLLRMLGGMAARGVAGDAQALVEIGAAAAAGDPYRLVVYDGSADVGPGLQFTSALRASGNVDIAVIMLASAGFRGDREEIRQAGIQCYLTDPIDSRELVESISALLDMADSSGRVEGFVTRHDIDERSARQGWVLAAAMSPERQKQLLAIIERGGFRGVAAGTRAQLWSAAANPVFQLLLVDDADGVLLPIADVGQLKSLRGADVPGLPVVFTGAGVDRAACLAGGADACVERDADVLAAVQRFMEMAERSSRR